MTDWADRQITLPGEILDRFRVSAIERIERMEAAWSKLVTHADEDALAQVSRDVHTLKGDARMVGFVDVDLVCHKLEDVLAVVRARGCQVDDDVDLVVTMALRFTAMLIRKRAGASLGGIDLPGFVRQVDAVVAEARGANPALGRTVTAPRPRHDDRLREAGIGPARERLAMAALDLLLEAGGGDAPARVQRAWTTLRDVLAPPDPVPIAQLANHEAGARELARDLGKELELEFDLAPIAVAPAVLDALEVAALHLIRNAIDHGVEPVAARAAAGKPRVAHVAVSCRAVASPLGDQIELCVRDDGGGVDFASVRRRAIALGLLDAAAATGPTTAATEAELAALLFRPGFSTRHVATGVSGRGIGLDVVASAIAAVRGTVAVASRPGAGATWTATVPSPARRFPVQRFAVRGTKLRFAAPIDWAATVTPPHDDTIDLVEEYGIGAGPPGRVGPLNLCLERGDTTVHVAAAAAPVRAEARWLVQTPPDAPADVVIVEGVECLLIRPGLLARTPGRVAILDDSEICRELVRFSLRPHGIEVTPLDDPHAAVAALAARPADVLLLDLSFRGVDYADLVAQVRRALPDCLVYLHSDRTPTELSEIARATRADGHLSKTLGNEQFVARLTRILAARRAG